MLTSNDTLVEVLMHVSDEDKLRVGYLVMAYGHLCLAEANGATTARERAEHFHQKAVEALEEKNK